MSPSSSCTIAVIDLSARCSRQHKHPQAELVSWRLQGMTLLEWLSRRLSESLFLDQIIITGAAEYLSLVQHCSVGGTRWIPSSHRDAARRAFDIAQRTDAAWVLFANIDAPLIDATLTDRMISQGWKNPSVDYIGYVGSDRNDIGCQALGLSGQLCSVQAIERLVDRQLNHCEDVPSAIRHHLPDVQLRLMPLPDSLSDSKQRFAINGFSDLDALDSTLEPDVEDLTWQRLLQTAV
jgi:spore coat polysaccharide biosynthesis protein SpsF (cytidylyltransferase family)